MGRTESTLAYQLPCDELEDLKEEIDKYRASLSR